ncbi:AraC family transcriptional regulator, partial [Rhizobium ruizarguesonis]
MASGRRKDTALLEARAGRYREYAPPPT